MSIFWIVLIALLVIGGFIVFIYNHMISLIEAVRNNQKQIDIQLDRSFQGL